MPNSQASIETQARVATPVSDKPEPPQAAASVNIGRVHLAYTQWGSALVIGAALAITLTYLLWSYLPGALLLSWLGTSLGIVAVSATHVEASARVQPGAKQPAVWCNRFIAVSGLSAGAWGVAGVFMVSALELSQRLVALLLLAGVTPGALPAVACIYRAYLLHLCASVVPAALWFMGQTDATSLSIGFWCFIAIGALSDVAYSYHRNVSVVLAQTQRNTSPSDAAENSSADCDELSMPPVTIDRSTRCTF